MNAGNAAADELERAITTLDFKGVEVLAPVGDKELSDPDFARCYFNNVIGNPLDTTMRCTTRSSTACWNATRT